MNALDIISELKKNKVVPRLAGDQLKLAGEIGNLSGELLEKIREMKDELSAFLRDSMDEWASAPIPPVRRHDHYPVSNAQRRVWVLSQFEGAAATYNIVRSFYLKGTVIKENLDRAFQSCINRHESLRTVFREIEGELRQIILDDVPFAISFEDLHTHDVHGSLRKKMTDSANWQFDLENGPLIRVDLFRIAADEYAMIFGVHHIVSDGWSMGVMVREVMRSYEAFCKKEEYVKDPLKIHYKDYAKWLSEKMEGTKGLHARNFWIGEFPSVPDPLVLPTDSPRPDIRSFDGAVARFYPDKALYTRILAFCKESHVTLFNFFRTGLTILLSKLSGQDDITIGTPVSGRNHFDLDEQIGLYVNTLPLRAMINQDDSFLVLLRKISDSSLRAFEFQDYPFDKIIEDLEVKRNTSRNPLFDVLMVLQNTAMGDGSIKMNTQYGFELSLLDKFLYPAGRTEDEKMAIKFDLSFNFDYEPDHTFYLEIEYDTKLFTRDRVARLFNTYIYIITQVLQDPALRIRDIEMADAGAQRTILTGFNVPVDGIDEYTIPGLLQGSFLENGQKTAIVSRDREVSYEQLAVHSRNVARYLSAAIEGGAKTMDERATFFVGLLMDRSEWTIISMLGSLQAGAAYVPIDINYPPARIGYIINDARPSLILVDDKGLSKVPADYAGKVVHIDLFKDGRIQGTDDLSETDLRERTAYLIYTSGSTGQSKAVEICHRNTIAFLRWAKEEFAQTPFDILYATSSFCFDLSIFEIFLPLVLGKRIRLLSSALEIQEFVGSDERVMINTVPSVVRSLLDSGMDWSNVAALNMAGEAVPVRFKQELDHRKMEVRNLYGPSEDTTYSTMYRFREDGYTGVPIGRPVGYTRVYIMNGDRQLMPIGFDGEIYLSGQSVAKGYLNRPALTAAKFLDDPFAPGLRMYKTGDTGKWLPDGMLEFIGRVDDQVKIRGYRIELGEIQFFLERHALVRQAFVMIRSVAGEDRIVAYYTGNEANAGKDREDAKDGLTAPVLKEFLLQYLPSYMIPDYFVPLDEISLNSNGKVDKQQLPHPEQGILQETALIEPRNETERQLLDLWKEVLPRKEMGVTHNFFDIGGHSLKATRLRSLIARSFGRELTLNDIFRNPTVDRQAVLLASRERSTRIVIQKTAPQPHYPISFAQERLWVLINFEEASKAYNMPAAFSVTGTVDVRLLEAAFKVIIERHEILRTVFDEKEGRPVQVILDPDHMSFSIEEVYIDRELTDEEEQHILQQKWQMVFDLRNGPLLSCFLLRSPKRQLLAFNMHHIISDGWSIGVLYKELITAYRALAAGQSLQWPRPELQYRDFSVWQRGQLNADGFEKHRAFWMDMFNGEVPVLNLPVDLYRPEVKTYNGAVYRSFIDTRVTSEIGRLEKEAGASLFMVLMAGVSVLLKKYTDQNDIVIGTPVAGRDRLEMQDQIGFYVNTLAIRTKMDGDMSFLSLLQRQKDVILEAFEFQDYPFGMLVEALQLKRDLSRSPLFDVMVVLQNLEGLQKEDMRQVTTDLQFDRLDISSGIAKYDLSFSFSQQENGLELELEYNTDLFAQGTIVRMAGHLVRIFEQAARNAGAAIKDITLSDSREYDILRTKADQTGIAYDRSSTIVSLFQKAAAAFPGHIALKVGEKEISYEELDRRSGQLAGILINELGVSPEELVILHFDRDEWMIIGILAVLKAGAAYVPVDPAYPGARIDYIIGDSNSRLILFDTPLIPDIAEKYTDRIFMDVRRPYEGPAVTAFIQSHQLAYVIYTSGTTGNPKGVLIEHRNVTRLLFTDNNLFAFDCRDRWSLFHSYCFDFSVWEMFGALLNGGILVMVPKEIAQDSIAFYQFLLHERITVLNQTPTAFRSLIQHNGKRLSSSPPVAMRYLIFGGEALMPEILRDWAEAVPGCRNINMYGITETTVHVTYKEISEQEIKDNKSNIGLPIPTLSCYVLDRDLRQVPIGVTGELCVGGAGVARGYLNKPSLTAERFIADPVRPWERIYRSGDYACVLVSGDLEYIGRRDDQVKIRGHRIETSEIAAVIIALEGMEDAIVLPLKNANGEYDLAAYFISNEPWDIRALRKRLSDMLPTYMVPAYLIPLTAFPINENGKLDKRSLPQPEDMPGISIDYIPASTEIDRQIIAIWEEVLERGNIGMKDNFFDLGGNSLKATRVISKIHEAFGVKIDLKNLFIDPTAEHLSNYVETIQWMGSTSEVSVEGESEITF